MAYFPNEYILSNGLKVSSDKIVQILRANLTEPRFERMLHVCANRTAQLVPVLEDIYDRGNISAVMRSSEAFGFQVFQVIEKQEKFKVSNRVSQGADKWLTVQRWKNTTECLTNLKSQGYRIFATTLEKGRPIDEFKFDQKTAIIFGNEKNGVSEEALSLTDERVFIPMQGFVQSFNISVAAALTFYHVYHWRQHNLPAHGDLTDKEQHSLLAKFCLDSLESAEALITHALENSKL